MSPRDCTCDKQDLAVTVRIDGDPGATDSTVSITCAMCHGPVWLERDAAVEAVDIPMRLDREADEDIVVYRLRAEDGR